MWSEETRDLRDSARKAEMTWSKEGCKKGEKSKNPAGSQFVCESMHFNF